ncbi:hypothetical protein L3X38_028319 [Prunus dulcis]|uniref:Uncharacterized protein n=1 Tax=Prunus dulcis TaxID=3755 RepID=A0AAD4VS94_PRUDU|nr:hypothetical protein L3X38_028319 [Prunus dulcis]
MCRTHPESLKGDPGARQLPKGNHPKGCAEHTRSLSRGTLVLANFLREITYEMCRTHPESLKGDPGARHLPKGNHSKGCAEHTRSLPRGTLVVANFLREITYEMCRTRPESLKGDPGARHLPKGNHIRDVQNTPGVPQGGPWYSQISKGGRAIKA